jgi:hypothetical protein
VWKAAPSLDSLPPDRHRRAPALDKGTPGESRVRKATGLRSSATPSIDATKDPTTAGPPKGSPVAANIGMSWTRLGHSAGLTGAGRRSWSGW